MHRIFSLVVLALLGCDGPGTAFDAGADGGRQYEPEPFTPSAETIAYCPGDDAAIEARITALLAALTPNEKVALMHGAGLGPVDGVWLASENERLAIPGLHMLDGPRGLSRFSQKTGTAFPVAMMRGATWDPALERRVGEAMARELRSAGADVLLAPTINILRHPRWGRAQETYGEDVHHLGELGVAFIEGVQSEGVIASVKHYALNSIEDTRHDVDVIVDERTLREVYLPHFRRAVVEARVGSVMSAYNQVNGRHCDQSAHLLSDILRDEWGFAGFVESDWVLGTHGDVESVRAGLDLEMPAGVEFRGLRRALTEGAIEERELDVSVRRILRAQLCYGLDERERGDDPSGRNTDAHRALALEVAERGIVLLRNEGAALPLDRASVGSVVVLGRAADVENIGDEGSSRVEPVAVITALEGLVEGAGAGVTVTHVTSAADPLVASAGAVVVVTGLLAEDEGESDIAAGDRETLALAAEEVALIRAVAALNDRVIVVLEGGAAITTSDWHDEVEGLLFAFYPGQEGGAAIARVLFGDVAPSGRLPFTIPAREDDLPLFDNTSLSVTYGFLHGYRWLDEEEIAPAFPFGFGLSYTAFAYAGLALSASEVADDGTLSVSVDVTNTGSVRGRETVQLYVGVLGSSVSRAEKDLRAFTQVELAPGETRTVTLSIAMRDLAYWSDGWIVEAADYEVRVGSSAADLPLTGAFRVE
jgi:beta-glucosidase